MAYQPTKPPPDVNEPALIDSPYSPPDVNIPQGDLAWPFHRSQSTPAAAQGQISLEPHGHLQSKPGEKRKNKLGYSRTPVACGPCRQRKIRCIPSASDPQSSCENCSRLNKECTFIPTDSQQGHGPSSNELAAQTRNTSPPDARGESYLRSPPQGYQSAASLGSPAWSQPSPSSAAISSDRDDMYAVPVPNVSSQQAHFTLSHSNAPTYVTSGVPSYTHGGAAHPEGWRPPQADSSSHKYSQAPPYDPVYGRTHASPYGANWDSSASLRSASYGGETSAQNVHHYDPGHPPMPYQPTSPQAMTSSMPMSSNYAPVVPSQAPSQGHSYGMVQDQQHVPYHGGTSGADWTYHQRNQNHDRA